MNTETQEITIIKKVEKIIDNSGVELELDLTKLANLAERGRAIKSVDDENFFTVKREMQKTRKILLTFFKEARDGFNKQAKGVIEVQNIVLDEFTPEETRLIALDKAEKERVKMEERVKALPAKRERITESGIEFTDEEILALDDAEFEIEYNVRLGEKLVADRIELEKKKAEEEAKIEAERLEIQRQKDEADRIEKARVEERERAEREAQEAKERAEEALRIQKETAEREAREAKEKVEREEKERKERIEREEREAQEAKERAEAEKAQAEKDRLANEKYQTFLKENNYNEETDIIVEGTKIYRLVAEFKA